jgi:hypothetical protein
LTDDLKEFDFPKFAKGGKVSMEITFDSVSSDLLKILTGSNHYPVTAVDGLGSGTETELRDNIDRAKDLGKVVPGLQEKVKRPCDCVVAGRVESVWNVIIHLNDQHSTARVMAAEDYKTVWTREDIADWLDSLDIDLRVQNDKEED